MAGEEKPWSKDWLIARWNKGLKGVKRRIRAFTDSVLRRKHPSVSYRFLAQQIEGRFADHSGSRTIVFSSADPQDISTETLLTIAYFLHVELGKKVLLVDGSFGLSDLSDRLDSLTDAGLSE